MIGQSKTIVKQNLIFIIMKTKSLFVSIFVLTLFVSCAENAVELPKNPPKHLVLTHAMQNSYGDKFDVILQ